MMSEPSEMPAASGRRAKPIIIVADSGYLAEVVSLIEHPVDGAPGIVVALVHDGDSASDLSASIAARLAVPLLGSVDDMPNTAIALTVGSTARREELAIGRELVTLVHQDATVGRWVELGEGTIVSPGARLTANITVGRGCLINAAAVLSHDDVLGDFVTVSPSATLCGGVTVGSRTNIFAGATIMPGVTIGDDATVGAGALVNSDVASGVTVIGVPARPLK
ncbi:MAG: acetyltransferase [Acidimicrobiales bacterium]|jgi:sugar O-acyltransferase (sialic acid O-acetyltransferase NeuD family)